MEGRAGVDVRAHGLGARGPLGPVFEDVTCAVGARELAAITGRSGSGRTSLLLTLAGRMRPSGGRASVGGHDLPREARAVRGLVAVARAGDAVDLPGWWRVREAIDYRGLLRRRPVAAAEARAAFERVGLEAAPDAYVHRLGPRERTLLAVALASLEGRPAMVLDDLDAGIDADDQRRVWRVLQALTDAGATVIATAVDAAPARGIADAVVRLDDDRRGGPA